MNSGDLILFEGKNYWFSDIIEISTHSKFSHVGCILKADKEIFVLESGYEKYDGIIKWGVQLTPLNFLLKNYDGNIYLRKINSEKDLTQSIQDIYSKVKDLPYDTNILHFLRAYFSICIGNCRETHSFFCSALVSYVYSQLGILPEWTAWDLISPEFLAEVKAQPPFHFEEIEELKRDTSSSRGYGCII